MRIIKCINIICGVIDGNFVVVWAILWWCHVVYMDRKKVLFNEMGTTVLERLRESQPFFQIAVCSLQKL